MGFNPQPNLWQCGPFALKHALITLGIFVDEQEISRIAGSNKSSGTDELQLARAARKFGCELLMGRENKPDEARREMETHLRRGSPCLVCAYEWTHWVTVVKEEKGQFIVLDSRDDAVLSIYPWDQFRKCWVYHRRDEYNRNYVETVYDFHPVLPRFRVQTRARFSLARARYLRRSENREFSRQWDEYLEDMLTLCKPRTPLSSKVFSLGEFLRRHEGMILDQLSHWHGGIERRRARRVLQNMHFVADTYGLIIHEEDEKRAIAGITAILSLWAGGRYGVKPIYQEAAAKKPAKRRR
jgi:hypothetical protein